MFHQQKNKKHFETAFYLSPQMKYVKTKSTMGKQKKNINKKKKKT